MRRLAIVGLATFAALLAVGLAGASPGNVRLTNDFAHGYVSAYTLGTGNPYTDATIAECGISRGRQNEPAVAVDPRDTHVLLGSSNDYCGVYNRTLNGFPVAAGPIWLGYYRSQDSGGSWTSSLVPGYPDDTSPYAALSRLRTATSGDPVVTWDNHGRAFFGAEASGDPAGTPKTFGDEWVARFRNPDGVNGSTSKDGLEYYGTTTVAKGTSAPNLLGKFNDKTAIEADRTGGPCDGNVYFSWSRFSGNAGDVAIYFVRSTDHGVTFSSPMKISASIRIVQNPDIAVTNNGHVYVAFREFASSSGEPNGVVIAKSTDCGQTFSPPQLVTTFTRNDAQDVSQPAGGSVAQSPLDDPTFSEGNTAPGSTARDCGDFADHCASGYTFFRHDTQVRATADQLDSAHEWIYIVYDATKPGTEVPTGTTYGTDGSGTGGQAGIYFTRYNGAAGSHTAPALLDNESTGHQIFPDISADGGVLHALWWDSRNDACYSPARPIGNCAGGGTDAALDVFATSSTNGGNTWATATRVTDTTTNPNYEQFGNRAVPFAGDYLWVTSMGAFSYGVWTDWRNTVPGTDPRETAGDPAGENTDVNQCRTSSTVTDKKGNTFTVFSSDHCPHDGGIDQNIFGDATP
jgi:hypothetical protein